MVPPTHTKEAGYGAVPQHKGSSGGSPGTFHSWSALGCWRGVSGGRDFSAGWTQSPSWRAWLPALLPAPCGPRTSGSRWHTCLSHSWAERGQNQKHTPSAMSSSIPMPWQHIPPSAKYASMQIHCSSQQKNSSSEKLQHKPELQGSVKLRQTMESLGNPRVFPASMWTGHISSSVPCCHHSICQVKINSPSNLLSRQWNLVTIASSPGKCWVV